MQTLLIAGQLVDVNGQELLQWRDEILSMLSPEPTDRDLAQATKMLYARVMPTQEWQDELAAGRETLQYVQGVWGCYTIDFPGEEVRRRFTARRGMVSVKVLPEQFVAEAYRFKQTNQGWRLPELLVLVPIYWLRQREFFVPRSDLQCLETNLPYHREYGLQAPAKGADVVGGLILD